MKFQGKIDLWFWLVMLFGEVSVVCASFDGEGIVWIGVFAGIILNLCFLPFVIRNHVEISEDELTIAFGFSRMSIGLSEIRSVSRTNNPMSSTAASLDRIVIKGNQKELLCAVKDRDRFFQYLQEKCPNAQIDAVGKNVGDTKVAKLSIAATVLICAVTGIWLTTGDIKIEYGKEAFTIVASYWPDKEITYEEIENIEYVDHKVKGSRVGGFGSWRLLMGNFKNREYGNYTRYTYTKCEAGVVLIVDGREVVVSGKDKESTKVIYEELMERIH